MGNYWIWKYELRTAAVALNSKTARKVYEGALVRDEAGFGCLHTWPELGDPTLQECLDDLAGNHKSSLVKQTLACIEADGEARAEGRSLFEGLKVPSSHATLPVLNEMILCEAVQRGFSYVKVKGGKGGGEDLRGVRAMMRQFPKLKWRIDFNENGEVNELLEELSYWSEDEKAVIDFLEDPVPYLSGGWERLVEEAGVGLALDRQLELDRGDSDVQVVKPAVQEMKSGSRVVVTSYMDHPLGQAFAAWEAARAGVKEVCGLQTHGLFEPDEFSEILGPVSPEFKIPEGAGLGFGDLLESLPWTKLPL